jgi:hypothetical protein
MVTMPAWLVFLCYLVALVCFVLAAAGVSVRTVNLVAAGLAAWVLVPLAEAWPG